MSDGFMSSWAAPVRLADSACAGEETEARRLPKVHFHAATLMSVRRALLFARPGEALGVLRGYRSSHPENDVLFDALIPVIATTTIRPGAVVVPVGLTAGTHRPWRDGRKGGDGSLLKLFGSVATAALLEDGHGVNVALRVSLPRFELLCFQPLNREECPRIADVSLGIVLRGGDTVREGEHIGFLLKAETRGADAVEPVLLTDSVGRRAIVGMWTLSDRDTWAAAAVFAADSMMRRNSKISRPTRSGSGSGGSAPRQGAREVDFLVAHFHERLGGEPTFLPCRMVLPPSTEPQEVPFVARLSARAHDPEVIQGRVLSAEFSEEISAASVLRARGTRDATGAKWLDSASGPTMRSTGSAGGEPVQQLARDGDGPTRASLGRVGDVAGQTVGFREGIVRDTSPISAANSQLQDIARQMRELQSDLGEAQGDVPRELDAVLPDCGTVGGMTAAGFGESVGRSTGDTVGPGRGRPELPGEKRVTDAASPHQNTAPNGLGHRLDELARKYIGESYWDELNLDGVR